MLPSQLHPIGKALAIAVALAYQPAVAATTAGQLAPALVFKTLDSGTFDLSAEHGKVVIVHFWATWCVPCHTEIPALDAFYTRFHNRGVELIGISVDRSRDRGDVVKAAQTIHYPVAMLADARNNGFGKPTTLPVTYIIDTAGTVRSAMTPDKTPVTEESLEAAVTPLLPVDHPGP